LAIKGELLVRTGEAQAGVPLLRNYSSLVEKAGRYSLMPAIALVQGYMALDELERASNSGRRNPSGRAARLPDV
jgi:hypothetical protein